MIRRIVAAAVSSAAASSRHLAGLTPTAESLVCVSARTSATAGTRVISSAPASPWPSQRSRSWTRIRADAQAAAQLRPTEPPLSTSGKRNLAACATREEFFRALHSADVPRSIARLVYRAVYRHGATSFDAIEGLPRRHMQALSARFSLRNVGGRVIRDDVSEDGTRKWLIDVAPAAAEFDYGVVGVGAGDESVAPERAVDAQPVEAVFIPERSVHGQDRGVLCVSSQVGCSLSCSFCRTGTQPLQRNLSASQILAQLVTARTLLGDFPARNGGNVVSNVVFMGQGEPLFNFRQVGNAVRTMLDQDAFSLAAKRITISTAGVAPLMPRVGSDLGVNLAISLHAPNSALRSRIMGINDTYPLEVVLQACRDYCATGKRRRVLVEYVLLRDVNDSLDQAAELLAAISGIPCHVNLIPFNPWTPHGTGDLGATARGGSSKSEPAAPTSPYECPDDTTVLQFGKLLLDAGITTSVRWPRGRDILGACGQLRSDHDVA